MGGAYITGHSVELQQHRRLPPKVPLQVEELLVGYTQVPKAGLKPGACSKLRAKKVLQLMDEPLERDLSTALNAAGVETLFMEAWLHGWRFWQVLLHGPPASLRNHPLASVVVVVVRVVVARVVVVRVVVARVVVARVVAARVVVARVVVARVVVARVVGRVVVRVVVGQVTYLQAMVQLLTNGPDFWQHAS